MAQRGRPSITKRQKELSRQEKRRDKEERRARRKEERGQGPPSDESPEPEETVPTR
ncbi:MAG: hypothetical protein JXB32_05940 [Deltaproteobacteria bacterium]|nr:hypothetical protein [Deltaproteobacteria bacterium]